MRIAALRFCAAALACAALSLACIGSANAQGASRSGGAVQATSDYLARMDTDADGRVSLSEYQDWLTYAFDAMDRDRNGVLVAAELPGGKGSAVTRVEHRQRLSLRFRKQDADRDGFLSTRELAAPPQ